MDQTKQDKIQPLRKQIKEYLLENPELLNSKYAETAAKFNTNYEHVRSVARSIRKDAAPAEVTEKTSFVENKEGAVVTCEDSERVKCLDDILRACKVDLEVWEVD